MEVDEIEEIKGHLQIGFVDVKKAYLDILNQIIEYLCHPEEVLLEWYDELAKN